MVGIGLFPLMQWVALPVLALVCLRRLRPRLSTGHV